MDGRIVAVYGNLVIAETDDHVVQNSIGYCHRSDGAKLLSEIIRVRGKLADLQVFEDTSGVQVGDEVELTGEMLSVTLAPGLLGTVFDGLQNPLALLAQEFGFLLPRGTEVAPVDAEKRWDFTPAVGPGETVELAVQRIADI